MNTPRTCDLSAATLSAGVERSPMLLRQAGTQLRILDVSGWEGIDWETLVGVAKANRDSLHELRCSGVTLPEEYGTQVVMSPSHITELLSAAPLMRTLQCDVTGTAAEVLRMPV